MKNVLLWILFGGLAGWLASIFMDSGLGLVGNILVGVAGAFIGGFIMDKIGHGGEPGAERPTDIKSFVVAVLGAMLLLFIVGLVL